MVAMEMEAPVMQKSAANIGVRIMRADIEDDPESGYLIVRGIVDWKSLENVKYDIYQRMFLPASARKDVLKGLKKGHSFPQVELASRSGEFIDVGRDDVLILGDVFCVDGQQRIKSIMAHLENSDAEDWVKPRQLSVVVYLHSSFAWESERFEVLNFGRLTLSSNVRLRNFRHEHPTIEALYSLSSDRRFPLCGRVTWDQRANHGDLVSCLSFFRGAMQLHCHLAPVKGAAATGMLFGLSKLETALPTDTFRVNVSRFWEFIESAWGIRQLKRRKGAPYLTDSMIWQLSRFISDHPEYWDATETLLHPLSHPLWKRLARLDMNDPEIVRLSGESGAGARRALYFQISETVRGKNGKPLLVRVATPID